MYRRILVPLDGSRRAEAILPHVEELAHLFEAKVIFLQVIEPIHIYVDPHGYIANVSIEEDRRKTIVKEAQSYLDGLRGEFHTKGIRVKSLVEEGSVVSTIISTAEREGVDLIAIASHGRTGLARVFYGSVAAGVLHSIDRPLLLVRAQGFDRDG